MELILPPKEFWNKFKSTPGALSSCEAIFIMTVSEKAPKGVYMTMGSHKGKDSLAAINSLPSGGIYYLIDTMYDDEALRLEVEDVVFNMGNCETSVIAINCTSIEAIPKYAPYSYVFSDAGTHSDDIPMQEVKLLEDRMVQGGIIAFHDVFSQFVKQTEAYEYLLSTGKYEKIEINWQPIFDYVKEHDLESNNSSWHIYENLPHPPNFVGALKRK